MLQTRWNYASKRNVADPTPLYPYPNNHDLQISVDRAGMVLYIGPSVKLKDPNGKFDRADLILNGGFVPSLSNGWTGANRLKFQIRSRGDKSVQINYLDIDGNQLGTSTHYFTV